MNLEPFILRAVTGGVLVALLAAPLGCLVLWQRMAYFGAALSHAALLGIAVGLLAGIDVRLGILAVSALMVMLLLLMRRFQSLSNDTLLGILAHSSLALGLVVLSLLPGLRIDLMAYLFGDILTISTADIYWIAGALLITLVILWRIWPALLSTIIHADLAHADGHSQSRLQLKFLLLLSLAVAVSMQVAGLLLIVSLLIIPAATAGALARSPEQMVVGAAVISVIAIVAGLGLSLGLDTPAGPSIVVAASLLLVFALSISGLVNRLGRIPRRH